jgi:hypothetical protein
MEAVRRTTSDAAVSNERLKKSDLIEATEFRLAASTCATATRLRAIALHTST